MSSSQDDCFNIMLATDCHLGYLENDPVRGNDALDTFEEILKLAVKSGVDLILLAGDLFHENKPSRKVMHKCMSLLRKYCMGERPVQFEFLSDQSENFKHSDYPVVNFEDPNLNISIPVFSIHGNHDDPAGSGCFCSLDLLSVCGLVNYFGKSTDLENINISPLMLQKGQTKLCLYGLGSIRDERLHRMFVDGKVSMLRPKERCEEWFNIMVLHQNRTKHGAKNYIPEQFLDDFLDLVVWGHEHECRIDKEWNEKQSFYVTQPGSSVATSLCHGEAVKKHVAILKVRGKEFEIIKHPLKTVRQFYIKDVDLEDTSLNLHSPDSQEKVIEYCNELVNQYLEKAEEEHSGDPKQPKQPLIRLRIFHPHTFEPFSVHRFGHSYVSKVANSDILLFSRKKTERLKCSGIDNEKLFDVMKQEGFERERVEDLVKKYFEQIDEDKRLLVISEVGFSYAVQQYVDKEVKEAINTIVTLQLGKTQSHLKDNVTAAETIDDELVKFREERKQNSQVEAKDFEVIMKTTRTSKKSSNNDDDDDSFNDEIEEISVPKRGRGRGSRGPRGRTKQNVSRTTANRDAKRKRETSRQPDLSTFFHTDNDSDVQVKRRKSGGRMKGVTFDFSD